MSPKRFLMHSLVNYSQQAAQPGIVSLDLSSISNALSEVSKADQLEQEMLAKNVKGLEVGISTMDICADEVIRLCVLCAC
jgi:hypothetical protein